MSYSFLKCSGIARVNKGLHSFTCHPQVYPQVEEALPSHRASSHFGRYLFPILLTKGWVGLKKMAPAGYEAGSYGTASQQVTIWPLSNLCPNVQKQCQNTDDKLIFHQCCMSPSLTGTACLSMLWGHHLCQSSTNSWRHHLSAALWISCLTIKLNNSVNLYFFTGNCS